jgi:pre-mRNA-processing factor 40
MSLDIARVLSPDPALRLSTIPGIDPGPFDPGAPGIEPDFEPGPAPDPDPSGYPGDFPGADPGYPNPGIAPPSLPGIPGTPLPA